MSDQSEEFAAERVPPSHQVPWLRVGLISAMVSLSLPTFITGLEVFMQTDGAVGIRAIVFGSLLLTLIAGISGSIGAITHLSSYMLTRIAFGSQGAAVVNTAFALSLLGWFGVNIDLFSNALSQLGDTLLASAPPNWMVEIFAGVVMTVTTLYGFRAINTLSLLLVPVMLIVTVLMLTEALATGSFAALIGQARTADIDFGDAMSAVVGGIIIGAVIMPDITRFIRDWRGGAYTAVLSYLGVSAFAMITGGLVARALSSEDLLNIMLVMGLSWGAFAIIIAGSWVLNALNLYSSVLSTASTWRQLDNTKLTLILGLLGTLAAFANILDYFLSFLFYLSIVFVPVAGVIAVDFLFVRRQVYLSDQWQNPPRRSTPALVAWFVGALIALLGSEAIVTLSGIAALDAMLVSAVVYPLTYRLFGTGKH